VDPIAVDDALCERSWNSGYVYEDKLQQDGIEEQNMLQ
jgi:hypothetical protein